jgi:formate--tetrahydrofolate ligase
MKTDIEIALAAKLRTIEEVAESVGISKDRLYRYGDYIAKLKDFSPLKASGRGKLILVSAINPTKAGEGKTTVSIGLADALKRLGYKTALALREPSLGPVFGVKGGAAGGGYAQVAPMEDINLHFTGDLHAITAANNLLSAMIDNHIYFGNALKIRTAEWHRCVDLNDRALRNVVSGLGFCAREDAFDITAASEIMAVLCLSNDESDLRARLKRIIIGYDYDGNPVTCGDLNADGAMAVILKDAIKPNLVQTLEGTPAFVHGGPFANIAHGCNSIIATKAALSCADYTVTEAGFGADLGAEKFLDIKCRTAGFSPNAVVLVATCRALKLLGGKTDGLDKEDISALRAGLENLKKHIENITKVYGLNCVVAVNRFLSDTDAEVALIKSGCDGLSVKCVPTEVFGRGGEGGIDLAKAVAAAADQKSGFKFCYESSDTVKEKILKIAVKIYGADGVVYSDKAKKVLDVIKGADIEKFPVCIAKTQYSLSDNPQLLGRPKGFNITVRDLKIRAGAGFIVALCGDILLMPGLSKAPNAENMSIENGVIKGLF